VVRFTHIRDTSNTPVATIAMEKTDDYYRAGISACSPTDQFYKKLGRVKASGRLRAKSSKYVVEVSIDEENHGYIVHRILSKLSDISNLSHTVDINRSSDSLYYILGLLEERKR